MGDWQLTIRGQAKLDLWLKLEKLNERTGGYTAPDGKKASKKSMQFDHEKREWVLHVTDDKAGLDGQLGAWLKTNGIC